MQSTHEPFSPKIIQVFIYILGMWFDQKPTVKEIYLSKIYFRQTSDYTGIKLLEWNSFQVS
jgi:hypothetical protein